MLRPWIAALAVALIASFAALATEDREAELREHFHTGMRHFRAQQYKEAAVSFEKFLEMKPDPDLVLALENESGLRAFQEMLLQQGLKEIALRILRVSEMRQVKENSDPARIASLVAEVEQVREVDDAKNFEAFLDAKERLVRIGAPAAPALIDRLVDEKHDKVRARVQMTLVEMRTEAGLPLLAALPDSRKLMRQNVCVILGQIMDRRAIPALKARLEDAEELTEVKAAAAAALRKMTGSDPESLPPAVVCFHRLAEDYHNADRDILRSATEADRTVWYYDAQAKRVSGRSVPAYTWNDYMAEQACYAALRIDPQYAPVLPTLICVTLSQMREVDSLLAIANQRLVAGEGEASDVGTLKARRTALAKGKALALSSGRGPLYAALKRAMARGEIPVAVACCEALQQIDDASWLPEKERGVPFMKEWSQARYFPDAR